MAFLAGVHTVGSDSDSDPEYNSRLFNMHPRERPAAPRRYSHYQFQKYKSRKNKIDSHSLIQLDLYATFLFLKLRIALRHFTLLCLTVRTRPAQLLLSDYDRKCVISILTLDSELLTQFILGITPQQCQSECDKLVCCCANYLEMLNFDKIIAVGKELLTKALQIEQFLDFRPQNMTARNQFLICHPRRPHHLNSESDKYDYEVKDVVKPDGNTVLRKYTLTDENRPFFPSGDRIAEFHSRPKNYRRGFSTRNHFLLYQHLVCALAKLMRITAHTSMGCFCTIFEENSLRNGFKYPRDFMRCADSKNYFSGVLIGTDKRDRYRVLGLHSDECCCQGVSPQIMCLTEGCCVTLPVYVERPIEKTSTFASNWYMLEKVYRDSVYQTTGRPRVPSRFGHYIESRTPRELRPVLRTEIRGWYIHYLLNRSQLDWSEDRTDNLCDPFVMRGDPPTADPAENSDPVPYPLFQKPQNNLDRFYNKIFTLNPSTILLLYLQTLIELKPWPTETRKAEEIRTILGLDSLAGNAKRKFPYSKYGRPTTADGPEHHYTEPKASDTYTDRDSEQNTARNRDQSISPVRRRRGRSNSNGSRRDSIVNISSSD